MADHNSAKNVGKSPLGNGACYTEAYIGTQKGGLSVFYVEPDAASGVHATKRIMSQATDRHPGAPLIGLFPDEVREDVQEIRLREALKRCSTATRDAAIAFRRTGDLDCVPVIIEGLIEHYVVPEARAKLRSHDDGLRLIEDLAIDSLTMLEIVFLAEEVLQVSIDNEELRPFRTVGDVKRFVAQKLSKSAE